MKELLDGFSEEDLVGTQTAAALQNFRSAMEGIGHIRRTLEETFGGLHGTHCEPDVLVECKAICDAIFDAYRKAAPASEPYGYVYSSKDGGAVNFDYKLPLMPERWDIVPVFAHPQEARVRVARVPTASQLEAMKELTDLSQELDSHAAEGQKQEGGQ